jgi:hypothetical protein
MALGVVVAVAVALLSIVVTGADRGDSTDAGAGVPRCCDHIRIRRCLQVKVRIVSLGEPDGHAMAVTDVRTPAWRSTIHISSPRGGVSDGCGCRQRPRDRAFDRY